MQIKRLEQSELKEFIELIKVFEEVFEMENLEIPNDNHLQKLLSRDDFFVFAAIENEKVVGGLTSYVLEQYYSTRKLAYVFDLAVKTEFQRQGIGTKLMSAIVNYCREKGFEEVFVQADKVDDYALEFYRSTGITVEEDVSHFYYVLTNDKTSN